MLKLKIAAAAVVAIVIGLAYWHYLSLINQVSDLKIDLAAKEVELQAARMSVEAMDAVMRSAEIEQEKSRSLQKAVSAARPTSDVELPKPMADAFLQRFGGGP